MQLFFAVTLFVSASLLFVVQPMFAKMVLPLLGGTPAVWNTCMVFYQAVLLAGYLYAHLGTRWLGARKQAMVHLILMALPWLVLPISVAEQWAPPTNSNPVFWLLLLLAASVGLPFLVVSASAPMLQSWFSRTGHPAAKDPYFLYAASNLGSMLALLGYPFVMEPGLRLAEQTWWWAAGYGLLMALTAVCAVLLWRSPTPADSTAAADPPPDASPGAAPAVERPAPRARDRLRWVALAMVPSSLLLGVTTHISTDLASQPLLWIVPLALYLLSFVLVFARRQILPHRWMVLVQPLFVLPLAAVFFQSMSDWFWSLVGLHLAAFFITTMVCHGELARTRPPAAWLTEFYLWMSVGGVLGGLLNAIVAPLLFPWLGRQLSPVAFFMILEYPLMIAAACMLRPRVVTPMDSPRARWAVFGIPSLMLVAAGVFLAVLMKYSIAINHRWEWAVWGREFSLTPQGVVVGLLIVVCIIFMGRPFWFGATVGVVLLVSYWFTDPYENVIYATRSFFGVMRVNHLKHAKVHTLSHGSTTHGIQDWDPDKAPEHRNRPQSYYYPTGPLGDIIQDTPNADRRREIGVVGLGTGSVSAYGKPGQRYTFFEIDPEVVQIARNPELFTYLTDCKAECQIVLGDARLSLAKEPDGKFDLLVLDAFSSDSIPIHLMTREAMALYLRKLKKDGVLAVHVSNRYLSLEPLVARIVEDLGAVCRARRDSDVSEEDRLDGKYASDWVAVAHTAEDLGTLMTDPNWSEIETSEGTPCWTDDFSNIIAVIRR